MHPRTPRLVTSVALLAVCWAVGPAAADEGSPLDRARDLARTHRYADAIEILEPYVAAHDLDAPERFAAYAELGRSYFHLSRYERAYDALRVAAELQPRSVEVALYVQACSWLTGREQQALDLFEKIVATGARDLHRAVTLPGERQFLADPRVWEILARHSRPLSVALRGGSLQSVGLGTLRNTVRERLPLSGEATAPVLAARAGRYPLWAFRFGENDRVAEIVVHAENVLRYTPFRITCPCGLDWRMTPRVARAVLGQPAAEEAGDEGTQLLRWSSDEVETVLVFGPSKPPRPPTMADGTPLLKAIRLLEPPPGG